MLRDLALLGFGLAVAFYGAYALDIFRTEGDLSLRQTDIELDEVLLIGTVLGVVLLAYAARQFLLQRREVKRRILAERQARELAYQDGLTGLPNRRQYDDALRAALMAPPRAGAAHGVFLLDLNGFKQVNDVHGHGVGDQLLVVVSHRLAAAMRTGDLVARFGGDEFAILAPHLTGPEAATGIAIRVMQALETPIEAGGVLHRIGVGIGIALTPNDATTTDEALRKADVALYRAKAERRSAVRFYEPAMDARVLERATMEAALRDALAEDRIHGVYQPVVNLKSRAVVGFEVRPQWIDSEGVEIPAERFVAIAEATGLIHDLADRVLRQASAAAATWPVDTTLSIDLYPSQLKDDGLVARTLATLAEYGVSPERLEIEITESALVAEMEGARALITAFHDAGIRVALDNFGTGYSSLYHLKNLKIDKIKIDRSFVETMASERESAGIVNALVGLGHGLGFTIAADGVDAVSQETSLIISGCEQGQGGLFDTTLSATDAGRLLAG